MFGREEFGAMADLLAKLSGHFILSLNDTPQIRGLFRRFFVEEVKTTYSVGDAEGAKNRAELIIANADFGTETTKIRSKSK
jgi:DNA adenine methylase